MRQRGVTLLEIMLSMAVVLTGMLGLFRVLSSAQAGSSAGQRITQAQARAQQVMEAIRAQQNAVVQCLAGANADAGWNACEDLCLTRLSSLQPSRQACVFHRLDRQQLDAAVVHSPLYTDSTQQTYFLVFDPADPHGERSSWVHWPAAQPNRAMVQITVGWNDDLSATIPPQHSVTLRTSLYRPPET